MRETGVLLGDVTMLNLHLTVSRKKVFISNPGFSPRSPRLRVERLFLEKQISIT
jgi:hypothetical protein